MNLPCDMLVFGGTGDLALHKLLPALYQLHREARLPRTMRIIGISRKLLPRARYIELAERHCRAQIEKKIFQTQSGSPSVSVLITCLWTLRKRQTSASLQSG